MKQLLVLSAVILLASGCKDQLSPHVAPEADAEVLVAQSLATSGRQDAASQAMGNKLVLTLNNAPGPDQPIEQEIVQQEVALFEKKNPDIRVEYSTWTFTPESFYERAKNHNLTDVIEVDVSQMGPIMDLNYAADITDHVSAAPEMKQITPEIMHLVRRGDRTFGVPVELHTMGLFYNRRLFERIGQTTSTAPSAKEKTEAKGADSRPRDFLEDEPLLLAQSYYSPQQQRYYDPRYYGQESQAAPGYTNRGQREVQEYYNLPQRRSRRSTYYDYYTPPGYDYYNNENAQPQERQPRRRREEQPLAPQDFPDLERDEERAARKSAGTERSKKDAATMDDDIITTEQEQAAEEPEELVTTCVKTAGLPQNWQNLIHTAVKLTDHSAGLHGFAPVVFAEGGGREFSQWCVQNGLVIEVVSGGTATLDVNTSAAGEVAQFIKDLRWHYDVTPPVEKCYADNLMKMFANGEIAMMVLPATGGMIRNLTRLGMAQDDIGVAALPGGPENRRHLTFGRCLVINSQVNRERRNAAFKWLMFQYDPERIRLREQLLHREQELTGGPKVPLFVPQVQEQMNEMLMPFRDLPVFLDYENLVAANLIAEPPYFTNRLYEAIAQGVRPMIEDEASNPATAIASVGVEFETKYLQNAPTPQGFQKYLKLLTRR